MRLDALDAVVLAHLDAPAHGLAREGLVELDAPDDDAEVPLSKDDNLTGGAQRHRVNGHVRNIDSHSDPLEEPERTAADRACAVLVARITRLLEDDGARRNVRCRVEHRAVDLLVFQRRHPAEAVVGPLAVVDTKPRVGESSFDLTSEVHQNCL